MQSIRDRAGDSGGGLQVKVTGAAGYSLDAIKVFGNINGTLLLAAALIVLILLIVIYRSPIFWIIPFFTVLLAEGAARGRRLPARRGGRDRSTASPAASCPCSCSAPAPTTRCCSSRATARSCAATRTSTRRCAIALRSAGPAILASGLTVIAALLSPQLAEVNGTAGLGPIGAMGVALAMISMLTMLPGRADHLRRAAGSGRAIPHLGEAGADETHGVLAAGRRPRRAPPARGLGHRHDRARSCSPPTCSTSTPG